VLFQGRRRVPARDIEVVSPSGFGSRVCSF
jgi:hypothetical protein